MSSIPPPFEGYGQPPQARKDKTGLIILIVVLSVIGICVIGVGAFSWFGFQAMQKVMPMAGCAITYEAMNDSLHAYAKDHDGKLPKASEWQDALRPYVEKELGAMKEELKDAPGFLNFKIMDPKGQWGCYLGEGEKMTGFAFNTDISEIKSDDIPDRQRTPIIFETEEPAKTANFAEKYAPKDFSKSPALFGEHRGWAVVTWENGFNVVDKHGDVQASEDGFDMGSSTRRSRSTSGN